MPNLHLNNSKASFSVAKTILATLWDMGEGTIKAFYPHPYSHAFCSHRNITTYRTSLARLEKSGHIRRKKGTRIYRLSKRGEKEALFAYLNAEVRLYPKQEQQWDGGWRIVFFDIPEKKRKYRDYLRHILRVIGFIELQKSVWIHPYPVPSFLKDLLFEENIKQHTRFITTERIEYDADLKKKFNLL